MPKTSAIHLQVQDIILRSATRDRHLIYREILCPPRGICLQHGGFKRYKRTRPEQKCIQQEEIARRQQEFRDDDDGADPIKGEYYIAGEFPGDAIAIPPLPTSIIYTNRQISQEASRILYNRFQFSAHPVQVLRFFRDTQHPMKHLITDIGFGDRSTSGGSEQLIQWWTRMSAFIGKRLNIKTVTICYRMMSVARSTRVRRARWHRSWLGILGALSNR